jgi:hypothetical protein
MTWHKPQRALTHPPVGGIEPEDQLQLFGGLLEPPAQAKGFAERGTHHDLTLDVVDGQIGAGGGEVADRRFDAHRAVPHAERCAVVEGPGVVRSMFKAWLTSSNALSRSWRR